VLNKTSLDISDYDLVMTITRSEFITYLKENFSLEFIVKTSPSQRHGFYALRNESGWVTFRQEREVRFNE